MAASLATPRPEGGGGAAAGALTGFLVALVLGFFGAHAGCESRTFENSRYLVFNLVIGLFVGLVGAVVGAAFGALAARKG